jgi:uncharacterized protein YcbK (DUF882 family)
MGDITRNLSAHEFECQCGQCRSKPISLELVYLLQDVRDHFNKPIKITSGYRCPVHNKNVGGSRNSRHMKADAADFVVKGVDAADVQEYLKDHEGGLGIGSIAFTHVDTRGVKKRWYY